MLKRPEIGVLAILIITSTVIPESSLPRISIGIGTIYIPDILLGGLLALIFIRRVVEGEFFGLHTPLDWPLLGFWGIAMLSTYRSFFHGSITFNQSLAPVRTVSYYLIFFVITNLVRQEKQVALLVKGIYLLATFVAA